MERKNTIVEAKLIKSQLKTIITFATNLEAKMDAFLDSVGAVHEKQNKTIISQSITKKKDIELKFHQSLRIKE